MSRMERLGSGPKLERFFGEGIGLVLELDDSTKHLT